MSASGDFSYLSESFTSYQDNKPIEASETFGWISVTPPEPGSLELLGYSEVLPFGLKTSWALSAIKVELSEPVARLDIWLYGFSEEILASKVAEIIYFDEDKNYLGKSLADFDKSRDSYLMVSIAVDSYRSQKKIKSFGYGAFSVGRDVSVILNRVDGYPEWGVTP
jgi:hypothetical protein